MVRHDSTVDVYKQALPVILVSLVAGLFAGTLLGTETMRNGIESVPGLLLLLPAFLATRGGVYGSLGARLSSGLHQGIIDPEFEWNGPLRNAILASFLNGMIVSVFIAVLAWVVLLVLGRNGNLLELVIILFVAALLSAFAMLGVLLTVIFKGYRRGLDPDNVIGPVVTTVGDVFGVVFLLVGVSVAGVLL
ncbi:magnesium transporter [Halopiger xanaduensis]|uniref:MgtE integral membrane region n=1 Tax=Halopiger xanaduensis (strain DSM 18323 / JCM 14033 / SH-6) TaxID=797210 RepID=F8D7K3_HALXS|nr:magnesium transporter [Halopiger xanaduensis]AEH36380.1 MgtE integral membrane region [Halopiger xanaduensis SH-6]